jgi:ParB/RepB/Spo0J family partition protein
MNVTKIKVSQIIQNENCRNRDVEIDSLMDSIKNVGLLEPIGVVKIAKNKYEVLYGNRRFMAVKKLGYYEIDAVVSTSHDDKDFKIVNLIENLQRKDITIEDTGRVIHELRKLKMTDSEIAVRLSIPLTRVKKLASCFIIPQEYKQHISKQITHGCEKKAGKVPMSTADSIMKLRHSIGLSKDNMNTLFEHAKQEGFGNENIRMVAGLVKQGVTVKKAIAVQDEYDMVRVNIPVEKSQMERLMKKHKTQSKQEICIKILTGRIRERLITFNSY